MDCVGQAELKKSEPRRKSQPKSGSARRDERGPAPRNRQNSWRPAVRRGSLAVAFLSFIAVVADILGWPIWPTAPIFFPGYPSSNSAFDVPFSVENRSILFPIYDLDITCGLIFVRTKHNSGFRDLGIRLRTGPARLAVSETRSYTCPFNRGFTLEEGDAITHASIGKFVSTYSWPYWLSSARSESETFTLNTSTVPPQWTRGTPLN